MLWFVIWNQNIDTFLYAPRLRGDLPLLQLSPLGWFMCETVVFVLTIRLAKILYISSGIEKLQNNTSELVMSAYSQYMKYKDASLSWYYALW